MWTHRSLCHPMQLPLSSTLTGTVIRWSSGIGGVGQFSKLIFFFTELGSSENHSKLHEVTFEIRPEQQFRFVGALHQWLGSDAPIRVVTAPVVVGGRRHPSITERHSNFILYNCLRLDAVWPQFTRSIEQGRGDILLLLLCSQVHYGRWVQCAESAVRG